MILLASNYRGSKHPQWYYNLNAHPECEFGGTSFSAILGTDATNTRGSSNFPSASTPGRAITVPRRNPQGGQIPIFRLKPR